MNNFSAKQLHRFTLLNHRAIPLAALADKIEHQQHTNQEKQTAECVGQLVAAISHSERSANFHQGNGFYPVSRIPFYDVDGSVPFYAHMLVMDPFGTGQIPQFTQRYNRSRRLAVPQLSKDIRRVVATMAAKEEFVMVEM